MFRLLYQSRLQPKLLLHTPLYIKNCHCHYHTGTQMWYRNFFNIRYGNKTSNKCTQVYNSILYTQYAFYMFWKTLVAVLREVYAEAGYI